MTFEQAIEQLKQWMIQSHGCAINIGDDCECEFTQLETYNDEQIAATETALGWHFPLALKVFLKEIGHSRLFYDPQYGLGIDIFSLEQIQQTSEELKNLEEEEPITDQFCMIGTSNSMGDYFGFTINRNTPDNFAVYCHEYPVFEYVNVSNELNSWRTFEDWIIQIVTTLGEEEL